MFDQHQLRRHLVSFQNRNSLLLTTKLTVKCTFPPSLLPEVDDRHKCHCMWQMQWYTYKRWSHSKYLLLTCCSFICIITFLNFSLFYLCSYFRHCLGELLYVCQAIFWIAYSITWEYVHLRILSSKVCEIFYYSMLWNIPIIMLQKINNANWVWDHFYM